MYEAFNNLGTYRQTRTHQALGLPRVATLVLVSFLAAMFCTPRAAAVSNTWNGVYNLDEMLTFYVVNDQAANFTVTINWLHGSQNVHDTPLLVRVFDPEEQIIERWLEPGERITGTPTWHSFIIPVTANGPGVYQVIITGLGGFIDFDINPQLSWGVYGYPRLYGENHLDEAYVYLPPGVSSLTASCTGIINNLRLTDGNGVVHMNISGNNAVGVCALPAGQNQVWRLNAQGTYPFGVTFGSAPIIACPDEATALAIRSSVDVLPDGTVCFHKFQMEAHALLEQYRAMPAGAFNVNPPAVGAGIESSAWLAAPQRYALLLGEYGVYSALPATMNEQNLDPASPWFGCIYEWHYANGQPKPNPWLTCDRGGLNDPAPGLGVLGAMHAIDDPVNPLYHNTHLRNRIIIAGLQQVMMIREHELPETTYIDYDGMKGYNFARDMRAFPWAVQQFPADVRAVWTEGLRRYVDHMVLTVVPQVANQWATIVMGLQSFASGTEDVLYQAYVQKHIDWMLTCRFFGYGATEAGYFTEGDGPDASYAGINMHHLAWLCEEAQSDPLKLALINSYRLYNHTIAPEPDGTWLGASSFNHRTPTDWAHMQWTGGVGMLADDSPEAAVLVGHTWVPWPTPHGPNQLAAMQTNLQNLMQYHPLDAWSNPGLLPCIIDSPMIHMAVWEHYMNKPLIGQLPVKADDRFTRRFGDEFMAVRRPSYYALIYCGKTLEPWLQDYAPTDPNVQYPRSGGGLSMLWSPKVGSSILAKNWSAYSSNTLIGIRNGQTYFENYWRVIPTLQASQARATIEGKLTDGNMAYRRRLEFEEDHIVCELRLTSEQAAQYERMWECFPYPLDKPDPINVTLHNAQGNQITGNNQVASAIVFRTTANETHVFAFKNPRLCDIGTNISNDAYGHPQTIGRVLTQLPLPWAANQTRVIKWTMKVVKPEQVKQTVKQLVLSMQ